MMLPYETLVRKRAGEPLTDDEIRGLIQGTRDSTWSEAQVAAFLMAVAIHGLSDAETHSLTTAMLESGKQWDLASEVPTVVDKHSTGGVGDKISLVLAPMLAACGIPVAMLTGRALGHTAGTADKLESIPGLALEFDRGRCLDLLAAENLAIGIASDEIAPADRFIYRLRDQTGTVESIPLITASILSKKLATGAAALVFDVKTGNGAFMSDIGRARDLAGRLVRVTQSMGRQASALITDMSQPLGDWVGHTSEIKETLECLSGGGAPEVREISIRLAEELLQHTSSDVCREDLEAALTSGRAREVFSKWAAAQGASAAWLDEPDLQVAPHEVVITAAEKGRLASVDTRQIGFLIVEAGGGRARPDREIDFGVALKYRARIGQEVAPGAELARLFLRRPDDGLVSRFEACFGIAAEGGAPPLIYERISG